MNNSVHTLVQRIVLRERSHDLSIIGKIDPVVVSFDVGFGRCGWDNINYVTSASISRLLEDLRKVDAMWRLETGDSVAVADIRL